METELMDGGMTADLGFARKWLVYVGDPALINGGDNFERYGIVGENDWMPDGTKPLDTRYWLVNEVADDANAVAGKQTEKWREMARFRIFRFWVRGREDAEGVWETDHFVIDTNLATFGAWNEAIEPDGFLDGSMQVRIEKSTEGTHVE